MGLEYVDIFYSHRVDPVTPLEETMGALDSAVRQGKALYVGISSYSAQRTRQAAEILRSLGTQPRAARSAASSSPGQTSTTSAAFARSPEVEVRRFPRWRSPGRSGIPRVASALVGASSVEQLDQNLGALDNLAFTADELAEIDRFAVEGGVNLWAQSSNA